MTHFTLDDLAKFTQNEKKMVNDILPELREKEIQPSDDAIRNILNYSKSLSVRKSTNLGHLRLLLN